MTLAILGGSFNPIHNGHIRISESVRPFGYDRILLIPAFRPPHKTFETNVGDEHRWRMTQIVADSLPWLAAWNGELERGGVSYSIDTVRQLKSLMNFDGKPGLVIGDDLLSGFHRWRHAEALAEEADLLIAHRESADVPDFPFPHRVLPNQLYPMSSTEIRERVRQGLAYKHLLPQGVGNYIESHGLYLQ